MPTTRDDIESGIPLSPVEAYKRPIAHFNMPSASSSIIKHPSLDLPAKPEASSQFRGLENPSEVRLFLPKESNACVVQKNQHNRQQILFCISIYLAIEFNTLG